MFWFGLLFSAALVGASAASSAPLSPSQPAPTSTLEKREMPPGGAQGYSAYGSPAYAPSSYPPPSYGAPSYPNYDYQQQYRPQGQYGGYSEPGFSVQTGFEGFLVPNTWYGMLPWGVEGVVVACAGLIVFAVIAVAIGALVVWVCGFGDFSVVKESARSYMPELSMESLSNLSAAVLDAVDKYNELAAQSDLLKVKEE